MKITIQEETTKNPISLIGKEAGICWGADIENKKKNYKRGISCIESNHGRTLEFPQVYLTLEDISARVGREIYTHIGGSPSRLQSSTRYINYKDFDYIIPPKIEKNEEAKKIYTSLMKEISKTYHVLEIYDLSKEDIANILPMGMTTKIVIRTNFRHLRDIMMVGQCKRAYWEFRDVMKAIKNELSNYSDEWATIVENYMPIKCEEVGFCTEEYCCGHRKKR